jgi:hypothetical protein
MTGDTTSAWGNGITLKRTTSGYSWTISVAAASDEVEAMRQAVATARQIDAELTEVYGPPRETGRPTSTTRGRT